MKTKIMGILNITPDSFSDGGRFLNIDAAVRHALQMQQDGADIIDIGGESSRPNAAPVSVSEEIRRVIPVIQKLRSLLQIPISIDTTKPEVAAAALNVGARIINDITGFSSDEMIRVACDNRAAVVVMHMQGTPQTMQKSPVYADVVGEIISFFKERIKKLKTAGIDEITIDPGIGFGKTLAHNLEIFRNIDKFCALGYPVLIGASRKSFISGISGVGLDDRLSGSLAGACASVLKGASVVRVHDVKETRRALDIVDAIKAK